MVAFAIRRTSDSNSPVPSVLVRRSTSSNAPILPVSSKSSSAEAPSTFSRVAFTGVFLPRNMYPQFSRPATLPLESSSRPSCRPLHPVACTVRMEAASTKQVTAPPLSEAPLAAKSPRATPASSEAEASTAPLKSKAPPVPVNTPDDGDRLCKMFLSSPVAKRAGLPRPSGERLRVLGAVLEKEIRAKEPSISQEDMDTRVYQYYLPIYLWMWDMLAEHQQDGDRSPLKIGFSCPQGGGKTTMASFMRLLFSADGKQCGCASLDDFYLTYKEQSEMASRNWQNGLLRYRGNPGTHDLNLLCRSLDRISLLNTPLAPPAVAIPKYDKTQYKGRGDRKPDDKSELLHDGLDVFLFEGWCMGFRPVGQDFEFEDSTVSPSGDLRLVDQHLQDFSRIYDRLDGLLVVEVDDLECVYEWRAQPEREARLAGKPALTEEEVEDFVMRFMPSYKLYTPRLYDTSDNIYGEGHELHIKINQKRQPV